MNFEEELRALINKHSKENGSDTPDFVLAEYLTRCLSAFDGAVNARYFPSTRGKRKCVTNTNNLTEE